MHKNAQLYFVFTLLGIAFSYQAPAQELDCIVKVSYEGVSTTNKDLLVNFDADVREYINNYTWGDDHLDEKIRCTFDIFIKSGSGDRYVAEVFIGSQRNVFGGGGTKGVLRLKDDAWEFTYVKNRPIIHNTYSFNDLASFIDFYVYLIIGYDYDSYDNLSGTSNFQKAANIANLGRSSGGKGWQQGKTGYSRVQLIDEILNAKFAPVRSASYKYHFCGLDSLAYSSYSPVSKEIADWLLSRKYYRPRKNGDSPFSIVNDPGNSPPRPIRNILDAIKMIGEVRKTADPRSQIIKTFFDVKFQEVAELFVGYPDPKVYVDLATIDPAHQTAYEEYRKRKK